MAYKNDSIVKDNKDNKDKSRFIRMEYDPKFNFDSVLPQGERYAHEEKMLKIQTDADKDIAASKYSMPAFFRASADEVAAEADARARIESSRYNYLSNRDRSEYGHKSRKHESNSRRFQSLVNSDSNNRAAYYHYKANENASKRAYKNSKNQRKHERKMYKKKLRHEKSFWKK